MLKQWLAIFHFAFYFPSTFKYSAVLAKKHALRSRLTQLADLHGSDKGSKKHYYTRVYEDIFGPRIREKNKLLEIGLLNHSVQHRSKKKQFTRVPSLDMWCDYFDNSEIYGLDIADFSNARGDFVKIYQLDQGSRESLEVLVGDIDGFDIIIDDALHASMHQQVSFSFLFRYLAPGGVYIIEDLHYQPSHVEVGGAKLTRDLLVGLICNSSWDSDYATKEEKDYIENNFSHAHLYDSFYGGVSSSQAMGVIYKKPNQLEGKVPAFGPNK